MRGMTFALVALFVLTVIPAALAADVLHMKDGSVRKGKIVEETATTIVLETFGTRFTIQKSEVDRVERDQKTPRQVFQEKYSKVDKKDPLELLALADWCKENGLEDRARQLFQMVIKIEPDNQEAREGLGHTRVEGKWLTPEELKARRAKEGPAKEGATEAPQGGAPKQDPSTVASGAEEVREKAKGQVAANKAEAEALAKEMKDEIGLDEVAAAISDHYILAGQITQEVVEDLAAMAEVVYWDLGMRFNHNPEFDLYKAFKKKHIILYFKTPQDYSDGYDFAAKKWAPGLSQSKNFAMSAATFETSSIPFTIHKQLTNLQSDLANEVAHAWVFWHVRPQTQDAQNNGRYLPWLQEGLGIWSAMLHTGQNFMHRVTTTKYDSNIEIAKKRGESPYKLLSKEWAEGKAKRTYTKNLAQMMMQELNRLDFMDLALAFGVLDYATRVRQDQLKAFFLAMRRKPYEEAWKDGFGEDLVPKFEESFRDWALKNY